MADDEEKKSKGGCIGKLFGLLVFLVIAGLGTAIYFISQPQDLSDIEGYSLVGDGQSGVSPPRDLEAVLKKSVEGDYSVVITEKEINQMLARDLKTKQAGYLGKWISIKRVLVRLKEDVAEVIVVREIQGYELTTSMFLQVEQVESQEGIKTMAHLHGGSYHEMLPVPTRGGHYGKLTVPQGFLILVMPEFRKIAEVFESELEIGFQRMSRFKIEDKRLKLDPNPPSREADFGESGF